MKLLSLEIKIMKSLFPTLFVSLLLFGITNSLFSQVKSNVSPKTEVVGNEVFRIIPTQNKTHFLKLDTRNGLIWQIRVDILKNSNSTHVLNSIKLSKSNHNNRFTLLPTNYLYSFILLDQEDGRVWQVLWSEDESERGIISIE